MNMMKTIIRVTKSPISMALIVSMLTLCFLSVIYFNPISQIHQTRSRMLKKQSNTEGRKIVEVVRAATTESRIVILTILDKSWARPGSVLDLFLESFNIGNGTKPLLNHLVIAALDSQAFCYCKSIHPHCYLLKTRGLKYVQGKSFQSLNYPTISKMRIEVLQEILHLGYSVVYTDADVMWLRNPFPLFNPHKEVTLACGSVDGGIVHFKCNDITVELFKFWKLVRVLYTNLSNFSICEMTKEGEFLTKLGDRPVFIEREYYDGFCQPSRDISKICTVHANCCEDLESKVHDLKLVLDDFRKYKGFVTDGNSLDSFLGAAPKKCLIR